jgi:hypothetical protein
MKLTGAMTLIDVRRRLGYVTLSGYPGMLRGSCPYVLRSWIVPLCHIPFE